MSDHTLSIALSAAVPLWIIGLKEKGGPSSEDWAWLKEAQDILTNVGEGILYASKKKSETAKAFNAVAKAIAIMSFLPGGITLFNQHWESSLEESR